MTGYVILSLGLAPVFTMATDLIVATAPPERAGIASGLSETSTEFGGRWASRSWAASSLPSIAARWPHRARRSPIGRRGDRTRHARGGGGAGPEPARAGRRSVVGAARAAFTEAVVLTAAVCAGLVIVARHCDGRRVAQRSFACAGHRGGYVVKGIVPSGQSLAEAFHEQSPGRSRRDPAAGL